MMSRTATWISCPPAFSIASAALQARTTLYSCLKTMRSDCLGPSSSSTMRRVSFPAGAATATGGSEMVSEGEANGMGFKSVIAIDDGTTVDVSLGPQVYWYATSQLT